MLLFLSEQDYPRLHRKISNVLSLNLPYDFMGYSTNFGKPEPNGVRHPIRIKSGRVNHMINIYTVRSFIKARLGIELSQPITTADWLTLPQQRLLELTSGAVYHDGLGELKKMRARFAYYPKDVWLHLLAAQWTAISEEEAFVGRTGHVGDELGSQVITGRLVHEIIKLSFLMERKYAPYSKWLGTAFVKLPISKKLAPMLNQALRAKTWKSREKWLAKAYLLMVQQHNALKITRPVANEITNYYNRPYKVIFADRVAAAIKQATRKPKVKGN